MDASTSSGASSFLAGLPSRGFMSSTLVSSNLGRMRVYLCDHETSPPEDQHIKTNQQNILIRSLTIKKQRGDISLKDGAEGSRKRTSEKALESRASAKRANNQVNSQAEGSNSNRDFHSLTVERLRVMLKAKGLSTKGKKDELIARLKEGIGNGAPISAVVTTPEIAKVLTYSNYFSTFGGNPVCTAAGLAVLRVIEKDKLQENAYVVGSYLKERLNSLMEKHEIIGDVRGRGMLLGVELVTNRQSKTPAKDEMLQILEQMKDMGVLVGKGGFHGNVLRITPPLCFTKEDADFLVDVMDYTMSKM